MQPSGFPPSDDLPGSAGGSHAPTETRLVLERPGNNHFRCVVKVVNEMGLHARPASLLVELASQFASDVRIIKGNSSCDGKSILQLLSLSAEMGTPLTIETVGVDAEGAIRAVAGLVQNGFNEREAGGT